MQVIIAGAGIGGLAAALALQAAGHEVTVFEAAPHILPLGVGINLLPHAAEVLDELGLIDALLAQGVATLELVYFNRFGQRIWREPRGRSAGHAAPQISLPRGALQGVLFDAAVARLGEGRVVCDRRLAGHEQTSGAITARFSDAGGEAHSVTADILIAADGIHSVARAGLFPDEGPPVYGGRILWRATSLAQPFLTGASMIMAGHQDQKFVAYPISKPGPDGRQRINWIAELRIAESLKREDWNRSGDLADFLPRFTDWRFDWLDVPGLIEGAEVVYEFPLVDRDPLPRWSHGRMTLLGDAAHAMYPIGSNGASQAILDARALVRALGAHADPVEALAAYEAERLPATAAIVRANRGNGPEQCMQMAQERAPDGFTRIEEVFADGELAAIAARYKALTGLKPQPETAA
ncbi:flavin-dependent oxidoreductase [Phenylobacterium aquaticum]|uniref:flavin-dependent oxidoreductase n=1 Tax=Phenylobacterium aquaticum TaxID=1763816 RepID=UPI0026F2029D|nr:flavin-dependent oxidoreductase [Phenylobacterium aquaticum]